MPDKILSTRYQVAHHLSLPVDVIDKMVANGMPVRADGSFSFYECREWRDERLGKLLPVPRLKGKKEQDIEIYRDSRREIEKVQKWIVREKLTLARIKAMDDKAAPEWFSKLETARKNYFEHERLLAGESTENRAVKVQVLLDMQKRKLSRSSNSEEKADTE
jgi:hypothetical protein